MKAEESDPQAMKAIRRKSVEVKLLYDIQWKPQFLE